MRKFPPMPKIPYQLLEQDLTETIFTELNRAEAIALDTETMGLNFHRDRLCLVQLTSGNGMVYLVQLNQNRPTKLLQLLANPKIVKIMHYARFDMAMLYHHYQLMLQPIYCTKIASRLARTNTDKHGLNELTFSLLNIELNKQKQSSDWGRPELTQDQLLYAAADVYYLHQLRDQLQAILLREQRHELFQACCNFLPHRVLLDLGGWEEMDIFAHALTKKT